MADPAYTSLYVPELAEVVSVQEATDTEKLFRLRFPDGRSLGHSPGQFVEVSLFGVGEAPISICSSPTEEGHFDLCVRAAGNVTNALHRLEPGAYVGIRGPFGEGFPIDQMEGKSVLFVGGGIGLAPLRSVIRYVLDRRDRYEDVIIFCGARSPKELLFVDELSEWEKRDDILLRVTVDRPAEGWEGHVGVITTLFPQISIRPERTIAAVVGPPVMYRFVLLELFNKGLPEQQIYFSLERHMKCGVGKCGHCQINSVYVCQEGPVFSYHRLRDLWEAVERAAPPMHR